MISCYFYLFIGACSHVINNFSVYIFSYPVIPGITFNEKKNTSIKGTWDIKIEEKFDNALLTSLARIPIEKKCTTENICYYYYLLGKFVTTLILFNRYL